MKQILALAMVYLATGVLFAVPESAFPTRDHQKTGLQAFEELFDHFAPHLVHLEDGTVDIQSHALDGLDPEQHRQVGVLLTVLNQNPPLPHTLANSGASSSSRQSTTFTGPTTIVLSPSFCRCSINCCTLSKCGVPQYVPISFTGGSYTIIWHWQRC